MDTLTTTQAAQYCGVHFRTVIRWINKGILKAFQLPGRGDNRIKAQDLANFMLENDMPIPDELLDKIAKQEQKRFEDQKNIIFCSPEESTLVEIIQLAKDKDIHWYLCQNVLSTGHFLARFPGLILIDIDRFELNPLNLIHHLKAVYANPNHRLILFSRYSPPSTDIIVKTLHKAKEHKVNTSLDNIHTQTWNYLGYEVISLFNIRDLNQIYDQVQKSLATI